MDKRDELLLEVAKLIWRHGITIKEFYGILGGDLDGCRLDADQTVAELAGIFTGWSNPPEASK